MNNTVRLVQLPKITDPRGNLSFLESGGILPFNIKRSYWVYNVPGGQIRGSHAFREAQEFIIALSGSFNVQLTSKGKMEEFHLRTADVGLFIPNLQWRTICEFSTNAVALILSSTYYDETDYIRNYDNFLEVEANEYRAK